MALSGFRLSQGQGDDSFVVVLADDGKIRVIARVAREAISDYFQRELTQQERVALVKRNLSQISRVIARKYQAGDHTPYTDWPGVTDENNRLVIIVLDDLRRGERLFSTY